MSAGGRSSEVVVKRGPTVTQWNGTSGVFWPNGDPLWDGQGCGPTSSCCTFNSPPWFNVTLPFPTTDNIEVRICNLVGLELEIMILQYNSLNST